MTLNPLMGVNAIERVVVSTYQSVSGTGAAAVEELRDQSASALGNGRIVPKEYPHQIAFNVLPPRRDVREQRVHDRRDEDGQRDPKDTARARTSDIGHVRAGTRDGGATVRRCTSTSRSR